MCRRIRACVFMACLLGTVTTVSAGIQLDQRPTVPGEWGYRPGDGVVLHVTPPPFTWRPQAGMVRWEIECNSVRKDGLRYAAEVAEMNVHCPPRVFPPGRYTWRYRGVDRKNNKTNWSQSRAFTIDSHAVQMPMPTRADLLARIPTHHPRLFVRPEDLPRLRALAQGALHDDYQNLVAECDRLVANPPPTKEPPKYPPGTISNSDAWRSIWWGNRTYTIRALNGAATLAFTRLLGGNDAYGKLAKRILMDCAKWDPKGATGYRYNDEAGMPYAYYFVRTYSFVYDLLSESERAECRRVMRIRGDEMYHHLYPRHIWRPYSSHSNRAWHFLGDANQSVRSESSTSNQIARMAFDRDDPDETKGS